MKPQHIGEFALIDWIRRHTASPPSNPWTQLGIGDDCAILDIGAPSNLLITTDMLMDGRHFRLALDGPAAVGYKAMGVNLSDIAAMAGVPRAAVVAVALPRGTAVEVAQGLHAGIRTLADRFGVDLVGGDTNAWDGPLVIAVTLLGQATARGAARRAGARPGDAILVTGPLGGSLSAGRHLRPEPRIAEALALHESATIHAMIDLSDGLSSDLVHILDESGGLGAILDADAIPIHADAAAMSLRDGVPAVDHALNDGEDFELCLTLSPEDADRLLAAPPSPARLYRVGEITDAPGLRLRTSEGIRPIEPRGFDHFRSG
ncbi:MAG: thiamine-phosphate kinase [Isosphaeraceae bacterium]